MKRAGSYRYNVLLVKDDVGRPKPNTRKIPKGDFTYGKPEIRDVEDASAVASRWDYSRLSEVQTQDKDFKRLNKSAIGNRATTSHVSYIQMFHVSSQFLFFFRRVNTFSESNLTLELSILHKLGRV